MEPIIIRKPSSCTVLKQCSALKIVLGEIRDAVHIKSLSTIISERLVIYFLCGQCIIFYNPYGVINAKPLIGTNIRSATDNEFPSVVSIQLICAHQTPVEQHVCTGTLISKNDVLTAEHCLSDANNFNSVRISMGTVDLNRNTHGYVAWWLTYVAWASQRQVQITHYQNDIAIIRLTADIPNGLTPSLMPFLTNYDLYQEDVTMAGWGKLRNGTTSRIMQTVDLKVLTQHECNDRISRLRGTPSNLEEIFVCTAKQPFVILGKGDSGGPLFFDDDLVAINKATAPALDHVNQEEKVNIHINITFYRRFIVHVRLYL
ncbi:PREDICTED: chymotrypsin-like elastase family member 2A [Ceratosolen solmsi marchali]|uniref:Chymotrypsin-like elastase family member 2A n=1 Tax=Ceratosolen solmsi marchali TaxID=326594 RepID=A0AAJ6YX47_9HYME|nr:PREDICTED: chymotrypsin-like elastase family member 2A [Ceratosolen solmsi marchali]